MREKNVLLETPIMFAELTTKKVSSKEMAIGVPTDCKSSAQIF